MPSGSFCLYDATLDALLRCELPALETSTITALLLAPTYNPDPVTHSSFSDIMDHEIRSGDAARLHLTGASVTAATFRSDNLIFGDPVTIGPDRYLAFLSSVASALVPDSILLGVADLSPGGGALEAQRGRFEITVPAAGWFNITRAA